MNFKVGQKVVCITDAKWYDINKKCCSAVPVPKKDEVTTIKTITTMVDGNTGLIFEEYQSTFNSNWFRPLDELSNIGINDLIEILPFNERKEKVNL